MRRILTALAAVTLGVGAALAGGTPALASTIHGCGDNYACYYARPNFNNATTGSPDVRMSFAYLADHPNGVPLSWWGFDNQLTCVVNNSRNAEQLYFTQYADGTGFGWSVPSEYAICYDGWWRNDKASRVWSF